MRHYIIRLGDNSFLTRRNGKTAYFSTFNTANKRAKQLGLWAGEYIVQHIGMLHLNREGELR